MHEALGFRVQLIEGQVLRNRLMALKCPSGAFVHVIAHTVGSNWPLPPSVVIVMTTFELPAQDEFSNARQFLFADWSVLDISVWTKAAEHYRKLKFEAALDKLDFELMTHDWGHKPDSKDSTPKLCGSAYLFVP